MATKASHLRLLNNSFRPLEEIRVLRSYMRQRENLVAAAGSAIQHMQKALTEMNIQLANVISDISGTTGMEILRAIVKGERDPEKLALHKHSRIQASRAEIARSLEGTWRRELLFVLEQSLELYDTYLAKITACDRRIEEHLQAMEPKVEAHSRYRRHGGCVGRGNTSRASICADNCIASPEWI